MAVQGEEKTPSDRSGTDCKNGLLESVDAAEAKVHSLHARLHLSVPRTGRRGEGAAPTPGWSPLIQCVCTFGG